MKAFKDKVAVVTGAASGIGFGLAQRCVQEGMKVVLADVEQEALARADRELSAAGGKTLAVQTNVAKEGDMAQLVGKTFDTFGEVHLLFNNAGVGAGTTAWESTVDDWEWVLGVNLWGVIHGIRLFLPRMIGQDTECHIVNTASILGLAPGGVSTPYQASKYAVVGLSEHLHLSLAGRHPKIKISVLCPGGVQTRILESQRNRPSEYADSGLDLLDQPGLEEAIQRLRQAIETGMHPTQVAEHVFRAITEEQFYILPHSDLDAVVRLRMENILHRRNPAI
jgi:NAD(P)-dependent dehydrogenase (short-subunit alcohol dehydrogenase family)